jgi:single-stranded-DNA-specific exonuclease
VRQGLKVMAGRRSVGLRALADVARVSGPPSAYHLGFMLGPRVNAGGRIGAADLGARLLMTDDPHEAAALAERLDALNAERRAIEAEVLAAATAQVEARGAEGPLVWAAGEGWHPGVVGIVASRLKERFDRPAVVIGVGKGEGKGSGRSVEGVDLGACVSRLAAEGVLLKGGGHRMAAGLTVAEGAVEAAMARLGDLLARQGAGERGPADLRVDGALAAAGADIELCEMLEAAGPWGAAAPAPRFVLPGMRLSGVRAAGDRHLFARAGDSTGWVEISGFGLRGGPLGEAIESAGDARLHLAGRLDIDDWNGRRRARLRLEDAAPAK